MLKTFSLIISLVFSAHLMAGGGTYVDPCESKSDYHSEIDDYVSDRWDDLECTIVDPKNGDKILKGSCNVLNEPFVLENVYFGSTHLSEGMKKHVTVKKDDPQYKGQISDAIKYAIYQNYQSSTCRDWSDIKDWDWDKLQDKLVIDVENISVKEDQSGRFKIKDAIYNDDSLNSVKSSAVEI